jgi:hypothetical protein
MKKITLNRERMKEQRFQLVKDKITALTGPELTHVVGGYPSQSNCYTTGGGTSCTTTSGIQTTNPGTSSCLSICSCPTGAGGC